MSHPSRPSEKPPTDDRQLRWVSTNRQATLRRADVGALAAGAIGRRLAQSTRYGPVYEAVCDLADANFRAVCRVKSVNSTTLSMLAKDHDCRYTIEKEWGPRITRALRDVCAGAGPLEVRFWTARNQAEWDDAVVLEKRD